MCISWIFSRVNFSNFLACSAKSRVKSAFTPPMRTYDTVSRAPVISSTRLYNSSRASMKYRNAVIAPNSMALAAMAVRWSVIREISDMITRMYFARSVISRPSNFSTAIA